MDCSTLFLCVCLSLSFSLSIQVSVSTVYNLLFKSCRVAPLCPRKTKESAVNPPIILYYFTVYISTSPNLSSITCSSTSIIALSLLVDLCFPNFIYICGIRCQFSYIVLSLLLLLYSMILSFVVCCTH
jgi:hypothetical protein